MSFKELTNKINFELDCAFTWGVKKDKFNGFSIPVVLDDDNKEKIEDLVKEHGVKDPLYGDTMYLKTKTLSEKQTKELFNKGKSHIMVHFKVTGVYTKGENNHLVFKVTRLRKVESQDSEDETPED